MKICFIGREISNALEGNIIGGAEKQQALIIEGLKNKGIDIVVLEYHLREKKEVNGIKFYPAWNKGRKSFLSKLKDIIYLIKEQDVNIVYARGTQLYIAFLYLFLKTQRSKINLFWGVAGNHDLTSKYNRLRVKYTSSWYTKINVGLLFNLSSILLFHFSDKVICQTQEQIEMCRRILKRKSVIQISNIYSSTINKCVVLNKETKADAIWIGKFSGNKGEDILLKIAKDIPHMKIICLGHVTKEFGETKTYYQIKNQNNLMLMGRVTNDEVENLISRVDFILNTSPSEGFSNVFLEAWNQKKPVISFKVNPNQYLTKGEAGFCANNSYSKLILKLRKILKDEQYMKYHGLKGKQILTIYHLPSLIINQYINLFKSYI